MLIIGFTGIVMFVLGYVAARIRLYKMQEHALDLAELCLGKMKEADKVIRADRSRQGKSEDGSV